MAKYTKEEIEAFQKKDELSARQSALKAASIINEGTSKLPEEIIDQSNKYYNWLYGNNKENKEINDSYPALTMPQLKRIQVIAKATGKTEREIQTGLYDEWQKYCDDDSKIDYLISWFKKGEVK